MFTRDISGDDVRWKKGYVAIIQTIGPHCCVIMTPHDFCLQSPPIMCIGVDTPTTTCPFGFSVN